MIQYKIINSFTRDEIVLGGNTELGILVTRLKQRRKCMCPSS